MMRWLEVRSCGVAMALGLLVLLQAAAQGAIPRVLYVGDSWTAYPWGQTPPSIREVFQRPEVGLGAYEEDGAIVLLQATAQQWDAPGPLQAITDQLNAKPTIDTIHFSLGGNDVLLGWKNYFTPEQTATLIANTKVHVQNVVNHCLSVRPDVRVVIVGYDYLNITEGFTFNGFGVTTGVEDGTLLAYGVLEIPYPVTIIDVANNQAPSTAYSTNSKPPNAMSDWPRPASAMYTALA